MKITYSKKVKWIKALLLFGIVSITIIFLIFPVLYIKIKTKKFLLADKILSELMKKNVSPPVISGTTPNGGAYYLSAKQITNNFLDLNTQENNVINITAPSLLYNTNNNLIFTIHTSKAIIDVKSKLIAVPNPIIITSTKEYSATFQDLHVNLSAKSAYSAKPWIARSDQQQITSDGIEISQSGNILTLIGPVAVIPTSKHHTGKHYIGNNKFKYKHAN